MSAGAARKQIPGAGRRARVPRHSSHAPALSPWEVLQQGLAKVTEDPGEEQRKGEEQRVGNTGTCRKGGGGAVSVSPVWPSARAFSALHRC